MSEQQWNKLQQYLYSLFKIGKKFGNPEERNLIHNILDKMDELEEEVRNEQQPPIEHTTNPEFIPDYFTKEIDCDDDPLCAASEGSDDEMRDVINEEANPLAELILETEQEDWHAKYDDLEAFTTKRIDELANEIVDSVDLAKEWEAKYHKLAETHERIMKMKEDRIRALDTVNKYLREWLERALADKEELK